MFKKKSTFPIKEWGAFEIDEVWVVPCGKRPDKPNDSPPEQRLEMTKLAFKDFFPK